jgi:hypothetical protein
MKLVQVNKWGVAKHFRNLPSVLKKKSSTSKRSRYEPQSTLSKEAFCGNLGNKRKGDATGSAETGNKAVRASWQKIMRHHVLNP